VAQAGPAPWGDRRDEHGGRGVDILLGGNPEGLAHDALASEGLEIETDEGARATPFCSSVSRRVRGRGDKIRELGGPYASQ